MDTSNYLFLERKKKRHSNVRSPPADAIRSKNTNTEKQETQFDGNFLKHRGLHNMSYQYIYYVLNYSDNSKPGVL